MALPNTRISKVYSREELCLMEPAPDACAIVIFGASGDLASRKLIPALLQLATDNVLPKPCTITGVGRSKMSCEQFRSLVKKAAPKANDEFLKRFHYLAGDYADATLYKKLGEHLDGLDKEKKVPGRLFYLSTPPALYEVIADQLAAAKLSKPRVSEGWVRLIVEKPYGADLDSAMHLSQALYRVFDEPQIYRIDHYLGKESVQNILMFRFANAIYEPVWNQKYIDHIQITAAETDGVGHRAGYYEKAGVLRDMFQNHLFQLLSLVAMEPPASFEPNSLRDERAQVIQSLKSWTPGDLESAAVRGQYEGYRQEKGVNPKSTTETFAACRVEVDNWRWHGVPFYLRSGKKLARQVTEITVQFKHVPTSIFKPLMAEQLSANVLNFRLQPNDGISLRFEAKHPGPKLCMSTVEMDFNYKEAFGAAPPEAYARLFLDVMLGDQTLFARKDWLHCSWNFLDPLLKKWAAEGDKGLSSYKPGSWGPAAAQELLSRDGRDWAVQ